MLIVGISGMILAGSLHTFDRGRKAAFLNSIQELDCLLAPSDIDVRFLLPLQISFVAKESIDTIESFVAMKCAPQISGNALLQMSQSFSYETIENETIKTVDVPHTNLSLCDHIVWNLHPMDCEAFKRVMTALKKSRKNVRIYCHRVNFDQLTNNGFADRRICEVIVCSESGTSIVKFGNSPETFEAPETTSRD